MTKLSDRDIDAYLGDPEKKQLFVTPMFDVIAPRYDQFTRYFSFGMDAGWKRELIELAASSVRTSGNRLEVLDLAAGTGDLAVSIAVRFSGSVVTALDASERMVDEARRRLSSAVDREVADRIDARLGDMHAIDMADASVDLVTAGYGIRNAPDPARAVKEIVRVLRPGGVLATLDFYRPAFHVWRRLFLGYLSIAGNTVGWLWYRDPAVYGYIARSIDHFMSWQEFSQLLEVNGMQVHAVKRHLGGGIALHAARKRE